MSGFIKTTNNNQALGTSGNVIAVSSDASFTGLVSLNGINQLTQDACKGTTGKIDQNLGLGNCQFGSSSSFQNCYGGSNNCSIGKVNMEAITTGYNNTACGNYSLSFATTGNYNTCVGHNCGGNIVTGTRNTCIGSKANVASDAYSQSTAIGYNSQITASNQIMLGTVTENVVCPNNLSVSAALTAYNVTATNNLYSNGLVVNQDANIIRNLQVNGVISTGTVTSPSMIGTATFSLPVVTSYPQSACSLTSNTMTVNGLTYIASQSSYLPLYNSYGYMAFNNETNNGNVQWITNCAPALGGTYGQFPYSSLGVYQGGTVGSTASNYYSTVVAIIGTVTGEWLQIKLPYSILITSFNITPNPAISVMNAGYLVGSNDGTTWTNLYTIAGNISSYSNLTLSTSTGYSYYRLIITGLSTGSTYFGGCINELSFNGTLNSSTSISNVNNITCNGTILGSNINALGTLNAVSAIVSNQATFNGIIQTQGLVLEAIYPINYVSTNVFSINYSAGGIYYIYLTNSPTANIALTITNIPSVSMNINTFTITVAYYQATTRYYINQIKIIDVLGNYLIGSSGAYGTPLYNGGTPSLTAGTPCLIMQQFTHIPFNTSTTVSRYVTTSVSCCS